jgi:5-methylcytosine-specific restriction protein A
MKITTPQIEAAYDIATQVFDKTVTIDVGSKFLQDTHGLNINSARDFINDYRHMLEGKLFQRAMSAPAIDYFLTQIAFDKGQASLANSIEAVQKHIKYYEDLRSVNLYKMRTVVEQHKVKMLTPITLSEFEEAFSISVSKAIADSSLNRLARIKNATKIPAKICISTETYQRNPDVVAETLYRAAGICGRCLKPAPFTRRKDGTPYLEVHHKKQLANGGEDTVENAVALCANCHRELHYGPIPV